MLKLWLDDMRPIPSEEWISFDRAPEMIAFLNKVLLLNVPLRISLDHDLGACSACQDDYEDCRGFGLLNECVHIGNGYDVLLFLEEFASDCISESTVTAPSMVITVHSDNASARKKMESAIFSIYRFLASS